MFCVIETIVLVANKLVYNHASFAVGQYWIRSLRHQIFALDCFSTVYGMYYIDKWINCSNRVLRYEDLALNVNDTVKELFKFLGLNMMPSVVQFLNSHTNKKVGGPSSTFRVSRDVPFKWKNALDYNHVEEIQVPFFSFFLFFFCLFFFFGNDWHSYVYARSIVS